MSSDTSDDFAVSTWQRIDEVCDRFEAAWRAGTRPQIEEYLTSVPEAAQGRLLRELILVDVEYRRTQGETVQRADYVARFSGERDVLDQVFDNTLAETVAIDPSVHSSKSHAGRKTSDALNGQSDGEGGTGQVDPSGTPPTLDANLGRVLGSYRIADRLGGG